MAPGQRRILEGQAHVPTRHSAVWVQTAPLLKSGQGPDKLVACCPIVAASAGLPGGSLGTQAVHSEAPASN